jgi:hypothetical protein
MNDAEPPYHLFLDSEEAPALAHALRLLISDEAHEPTIRGLAREVLASLDATPKPNGKLTVPLTPPQMKIPTPPPTCCSMTCNVSRPPNATSCGACSTSFPTSTPCARSSWNEAPLLWCSHQRGATPRKKVVPALVAFAHSNLRVRSTDTQEVREKWLQEP